ncbi:MAG: sigma factor [Candidatus Merdivicinus sp.]|jgi:RNA polymerase sigma factor
MRTDTEQVLRAAKDTGALARLIEQYRPFILREAGIACRRYLTEEDDEWSIALAAFSQAVTEYTPDKGGFPAFARLVIRRRLIDYYRSQKKFEAEIPASHAFSEPEPGADPDALSAAVAERLAERPEENPLPDEIREISAILIGYGFSFMDLADCSPKAGKTRAACARAVRYLLVNPLLITEMRRTRLLPTKILGKNAEVPRKILERHRKYIIAAAEILTGNFPGLAAYLRFVKEEGFG